MFIIIFLIILIIMYIFDYKLRIKHNKIGTQNSYKYIMRKYKLKLKYVYQKKDLSLYITIINSFILSILIYLTLILDINYILKIVLGILITILLILIQYNVLGYVLQKKGY